MGSLKRDSHVFIEIFLITRVFYLLKFNKGDAPDAVYLVKHIGKMVKVFRQGQNTNLPLLGRRRKRRVNRGFGRWNQWRLARWFETHGKIIVKAIGLVPCFSNSSF